MDDSINRGGADARRGDARAQEARAQEFRARTSAPGATSPGSLGGLIGAVWRNTTDLIAKEAELAKAEASEKITQIGVGFGVIAAGGAVLFAGFLILLMAAVNALMLYLPVDYAPWLAPLIVGVVVMIIGYAMYASGRKAMEARNLKPTRTVESMRRNSEMVKEHVQ